jgi:hypothetical protein
MWSIMRPSSVVLGAPDAANHEPLNSVDKAVFGSIPTQHPEQKRYDPFHDSALLRAARGESDGG